MVLRNPSLLNKRPATLAAKAAALRALPGLRPEQAAAAIASLPSLLNLDSQKLRDRWQRLQQVGAPARALAADLCCMVVVLHWLSNLASCCRDSRLSHGVHPDTHPRQARNALVSHCRLRTPTLPGVPGWTQHLPAAWPACWCGVRATTSACSV